MLWRRSSQRLRYERRWYCASECGEKLCLYQRLFDLLLHNSFLLLPISSLLRNFATTLFSPYSLSFRSTSIALTCTTQSSTHHLCTSFVIFIVQLRIRLGIFMPARITRRYMRYFCCCMVEKSYGWLEAHKKRQTKTATMAAWTAYGIWRKKNGVGNRRSKTNEKSQEQDRQKSRIKYLFCE